MVHEMRTYTIKVGKLQEYLHLFEEVGLPIISKYSQLVGFWYTEIGELNQIVHIWAYDSLDVRQERRSALYQDQEWVEGFIPLVFTDVRKARKQNLVSNQFFSY